MKPFQKVADYISRNIIEPVDKIIGIIKKSGVEGGQEALRNQISGNGSLPNLPVPGEQAYGMSGGIWAPMDTQVKPGTNFYDHLRSFNGGSRTVNQTNNFTVNGDNADDIANSIHGVLQRQMNNAESDMNNSRVY